MTRSFFHAAFATGLAVISWVAFGYLGTRPLGLAVTALVAALYVAGAAELMRFRQASAALAQALAAPRADALDEWLQPLPAALRHVVRLRIEGERSALPGPALAPALAGLLVLLGMLGTLGGMVVTLNGTGLALQGAGDAQAVRAALSAPVQGLGLAFGTSVAGVAASAALGLMAVLARRERRQVALALDALLAGPLRACSRQHREALQREQTLALLQRQAEAMPLLVDRLQSLMDHLARQGEQQTQQGSALHERLLAAQDGFHAQADARMAQLAGALDRTLATNLAEGARRAAETLQPLAAATLAGMAREAAALHAGLAEQAQALQAGVAQGVQQQLDGTAAQVEALAQRVGAHWQQAAAQQQHDHRALAADVRAALAQAGTRWEQQATALLQSVDASQARLHQQLAQQDAQRLSGWTEALAEVAATVQRAWQQAGEAARQQQQALHGSLEHTAQRIAEQAQAQARDTTAEVARLLQAAAAAPQAAAEAVAELRRQLVAGAERDNAMLAERNQLMGTLATLLDAVNSAAHEQRAAVDALVASSAEVLQRAGQGLAARAEAEGRRLDEVAAQLTGSAVEVASLGEAFGLAVQLFGQTSERLAAQLQRIEGALSQSLERSDEQLAYYVAQAREVIDLSLMSQQQIVADLQRLSARPAPAQA